MNAKSIVAAYLLFQATCVLVWWSWLLSHPESVDLFHPAAWPSDAMLAFMLPDDMLIIIGSTATAWLVYRDSKHSKLAIWALSAVTAYPTLYCIAASVLTGEAWLSAGLMSCMFGVTLAMATIVGVKDQVPAAFRVMPMNRSSSIAMTFVQIVIFWTIFLGVLPRAIEEIERQYGLPQFCSRALQDMAIAGFLAFSCLGLWSAWTIATLGSGTPLPTAAACQMVSTGPYHLIRNPMAVAGIGQGFAIGIWLGSPAVVLYSLAGILVWHFLVRPFEEADLVSRFGAEYTDYRHRIGLWLPLVPATKLAAITCGALLLAQRGCSFRRRSH